MIAAIMYTGKGNATLARDAMMAVVMIVLNGMLGLSLIVGGLRYREQAYNLQGANSFLAVILPLAVLGLVQPNFTVTTPGPVYSPVQATFLSLMSLVLYARSEERRVGKEARSVRWSAASVNWCWR